MTPLLLALLVLSAAVLLGCDGVGNANLSATTTDGEASRRGVHIDGTTTLKFIGTIAPWRESGTDKTVFDMPLYVARVRVIGTSTGFCQNFLVRVAGRLLVNEILGFCPSASGMRYDGIHLTTGGGTEVTISSGVSWSFTEVP